jgi:hypothetical protein
MQRPFIARRFQGTHKKQMQGKSQLKQQPAPESTKPRVITSMSKNFYPCFSFLPSDPGQPGKSRLGEEKQPGGFPRAHSRAERQEEALFRVHVM